MSLPTATEIEHACLKAWPALEEERHGAWIARFANGYTKRANSVQSLDVDDDQDAPRRIEAVAQAYRQRGLRPTFRVTPLAGAGVLSALDDKGWAPYEPSLVLAMELPKRARPVAATTRLFEAADPEWRQAQGAMAGYGEAESSALAGILDKIAVPARGVLVYDDAYRPVGAALAINADGIAIFLNVVVDPSARGQGYGRAVMHAALNWTSQSGAERSAIQVLGDNETAQSLYRSLGFAEVYSYHYRRAPE